jgi:hypothetical protein
VKHDPIDAPGNTIGPAGRPDRSIENAVGLALRRAQLGSVRLGPGALGRRQSTFADHLVDAGEKIACAAAAHRDRSHDGNAKLRGQPVEVNLEPAMTRDVEHVEREDHRSADALEFEREPHCEPKVCRIGDADEEVRDILSHEAPEDDVTGDDFIEAAGP